MLVGMATGLHSQVCVQDVGLTGMTGANGLACAHPSGFVGKVIEPLLAGEKLANSVHIAWATGGALVPADIREHYKIMYL